MHKATGFKGALLQAPGWGGGWFLGTNQAGGIFIGLDALLQADVPDRQKAHQLLALLPGLSPEAREEVTQHSLNLLPDDDFGAVEPMLTNIHTSAAVLDVLLNDLFNRPNRIKVPLCLTVAAIEEHPLRDEAFSVLQLFVEADHGTNWAAWREAVESGLQQEDNPQ